MKNREYWAKRFEQLQNSLLSPTDEYIRELERVYKLAQREIEKEIAVWYQRFADNNGIGDMAEARRLLNGAELKELKWDINEYIRYGRENSINQKWVKELENASARVHISSLEALKLQSRQAIEKLYSGIEKDTTKLTKDIYSESYYKTAYEMAKGSRVGQSIFRLNENMLDKTIRKPWAADGKNFSERIWGYKQASINTIYQEINRGLISGKTVDEMSKSLAKAVGVKESSAKRLVLTESAYFSSLGSKESFEKLGVERFEVLGTLDSTTCGECGELDGKVYDMKDYEIAVTAPPFHCNCRCTTVPYFDDEFTEGEKRTARNENGKTVRIDNISYEEWKERFVEEDVTQYRKVVIDENYKTNESRKGNIITASKITSIKNRNVYISDNAKLKPNHIRQINKDISKVLDLLGEKDNPNIPKIIITTSRELEDKVIASFSIAKNLMYISENIVKADNNTISAIQNGFVCPENKLSTLVHEFIHWQDREKYIKKGNSINSAEDFQKYIVGLRKDCKKKLDELEKKGYDINKISKYAKTKCEKAEYDETYTEYRTKKYLGG